MAIVVCVECGRAISDQASSCVGCGAPASTRMPQGGSQNAKALTVLVVAGALCAAVTYAVLLLSGNT